MAYQDADFLDEANLIDIPCEFCNDLFPMILLMEHQTACRPDLVRVVEPTVEEVEAQFLNLNAIEDPKEDKRIDPPINRNWKSITEVPATTAPKKKEPMNKNSQSALEVYEAKSKLHRSIDSIVVILKIVSVLGTSILGVVWFILKKIFKAFMLLWNVESANTKKFVIEEEDQEAIEKSLLQENEAFTFGSSNKEKKVEEEKLSYKHPPNPLLNTHHSKQCNHNVLTESDNEENESLEEFWKRAEIKLVQRERWLQKNSMHPG